jgi:hypothetical protein
MRSTFFQFTGHITTVSVPCRANQIPTIQQSQIQQKLHQVFLLLFEFQSSFMLLFSTPLRALRLGQSLKHDILPHIDLQGCETSKTNPRIKNLSSPPPPGVGREGIYLHWTLPPLFRTGTARTKAAGQPDDLQVREPRFDVQERFDSSPIGTSSSTSMGFTPANFYTTCTLGSTTQSSCTFYSCYRNVHDRKQQDKKNSRQGSR